MVGLMFPKSFAGNEKSEVLIIQPSKSHKDISELRSMKALSRRATPVCFCKNLSNKTGGRIYLKREDLNHSGAHKLNHCMEKF